MLPSQLTVEDDSINSPGHEKESVCEYKSGQGACFTPRIAGATDYIITITPSLAEPKRSLFVTSMAGLRFTWWCRRPPSQLRPHRV